MEGKVTMTDGRGGIILQANIWTLLLMNILSGGWSLKPAVVRIFIDGDEVPKPAVLEEDTQGRG